VHVFDPARFPYFSGRVYTPPEATAEDLLALQKQLHFDRVVIVQPSVYGVDNACTLDAMKKLGPARARGIAVIDKTISQGQLDDLAAAGMCGVRLNFETSGETNPDNAKRRVVETAEQLRTRNWHIQFNAALPLWPHSRTNSPPCPCRWSSTTSRARRRRKASTSPASMCCSR
jgi:predicted TIM-barrel fold metal-dependent hydrolase